MRTKKDHPIPNLWPNFLAFQHWLGKKRAMDISSGLFLSLSLLISFKFDGIIFLLLFCSFHISKSINQYFCLQICKKREKRINERTRKRSFLSVYNKGMILSIETINFAHIKRIKLISYLELNLWNCSRN